MLSKLLKYELKASGRSFLPLYGAVLVVALVIRIMMAANMGKNFINGIAVAVLFGLFIAVAVITIVTAVKRFKANLLSDEGYLMFTIPVKTYKLILSKIISSVIWVICAFVVAVITFLILISTKEIYSQLQQIILEEIPMFLTMIKSEHWILAGEFLFGTLLQFIGFLLVIYTSLSIAQISVFNKHRGLVTFVSFFAINIVNGTLAGLLSNIFIGIPTDSVVGLMYATSLACIYNIIFSCILFFATNYILDNHLNIE